MNNNRRNSDDENPNPNSRHLQDNQRIGRDIQRARGDQNWNEQYRSGQSNHNRNEGYNPDQTHYGSRPDSAYRDQSRINYGDNRDRNQDERNRQNQNRQQNQDWNRNQRPYQRELPQNDSHQQPYRNQQNNQNNHFDNPPQDDHAGTRFWGEREKYKQDDYRYTSGNRGNWEAPGIGRKDDHQDDNRNRYQRDNRARNEDEGFFDRMGNSISSAWNNLTGNDDNEYDNRNQHPQNRNFNRGYESGPRWADEDDRNNRYRYNRRDREDNY